MHFAFIENVYTFLRKKEKKNPLESPKYCETQEGKKNKTINKKKM